MLISCSSCNAKYLVNSADLKPNGRNVECAKCNFQWFQEPTISYKEQSDSFSASIDNNQSNIDVNSSVANLPSTYVKNSKPSIVNSFLVAFFLAILIFVFLLTKSIGFNIIELFKFYIFEFYFNFKLIINDLAKLTHQIIN